MPGSSDWRTYGPPDLDRVLTAALDLFARQGFHATSIRDIAAAANLSVPGLYHHYRSKQHVLVALVTAVLHDLLARSRAALASGESQDPLTRLDLLVECLLRFHMVRRDQAFVASAETRSLTGPDREPYVALRDQVQDLLEQAIREAGASGQVDVDDARDAARGVATLCVGVATWYRSDGPLAPEEIVRRQLALVHGMLHAAPRP
ncbi:TetR family transcriptional regulator [Nocardioides acrostichi]|uniref:TetR family transcriptional regulator n=1 Tax=Nocardioides acrostichi TaxID=2784339 RepID=A0A930V3U0_9ACTN|nr:TetR family transcriptional regulator [Nocardioides acrostichi]MBF4163307.1 TetR family transcriptional regulator [Nocardioides acrostichi]